MMLLIKPGQLVQLAFCLLFGPSCDAYVHPANYYIGCFSATKCAVNWEETSERGHTSPLLSGNGTGQGCINYCNNDAPDNGLYSLVALQDYGVRHQCHCFEPKLHTRLTEYYHEVNVEFCTSCTDDCQDFFLVWQTCPVGSYDPVSACSSLCPDYCMTKPSSATEKRCSVSGQCLDGCIDGFCGSVVPVETLGDFVGDRTTESFPDDHPVKFVMFLNQPITKPGYVTDISFYGRSKGMAYLSIWKYIGIDDQKYLIFTMNGKVAIRSEVTGTHEIHLQPHEYILAEPRNYMAVHFDRHFMDSVPEESRTDYTVLKAATSDDAQVVKYSIAKQLMDDNWGKGRIILINPLNEMNIDVSINLTISGKCPEGCKNHKCTTDNGDIICSDGCSSGYTSQDCSDKCPISTYGDSCSKTCSEVCYEQKCHHISGVCLECSPGTWGNICDQDCPRGLWGISCKEKCGACYKGSACDSENGECTLGCEPGLQAPYCKEPCEDGTFGINCAQICSTHCKDKERSCDKRSGFCQSFGAAGERCEDRRTYAAPLCLCENGKPGFGPNCGNECGTCALGDCDAATGYCPGGKCESGSNKAPPSCICDAGKWGTDCSYECGSCNNGEPCNGIDGFCPSGCKTGYKAPYCVKSCEAGYWGQFCGHTCGECENDEPCSPTDGKCTRCKNAKALPPLCVDCMTGYYGEDCSQPCPGLCMNNECNKVTGECEACLVAGGRALEPPDCACPRDLYGVNCDTECGYCTVGCKAADGKCAGPCQTGYGGDTCKDPCPEGKFGPGCVYACGFCRDGKTCDRFTGHCPSTCEGNYREPYCKCTLQEWSPDCSKPCGQCVNNDACNAQTGSCPNGCVVGYQGPMCTSQCDSTRYGKNCTSTCGHCAQGSCDPVSGECLLGCESGFLPPRCVNECPVGRWGPNCDDSCGECKGGAVCDPKTGACTGGCEDYYQPPTCINQCIHMFGAQCDTECPSCLGGMQCDRSTGTCPFGCAPGYNPPDCQSACGPGKFGEGCEEDCFNCADMECHPDGRCIKGCKGTYEMPFCTDTCYKGNWGEGCLSKCGHCKNCEACDANDGKCANGCDPGYMGDECTTRCEKFKFGENCESDCGNCRDGASCNPKTGVCSNGCRSTYMPPLCLKMIE